jgi:hypothetical protein
VEIVDGDEVEFDGPRGAVAGALAQPASSQERKAASARRRRGRKTVMKWYLMLLLGCCRGGPELLHVIQPRNVFTKKNGRCRHRPFMDHATYEVSNQNS